jgi:hypothetical protein
MQPEPRRARSRREIVSRCSLASRPPIGALTWSRALSDGGLDPGSAPATLLANGRASNPAINCYLCP